MRRLAVIKRRKTLSAKDGGTKITISILVESTGLIREEAAMQADALTGDIMRALPDVMYTKINLCNIKVR